MRVALGATPPNIMRLIVGASFWATRLLRSLLFSVSETDIQTFAAVPAILFLVGFLVCYGPARRAARIDPASALRA